MKSKEDIKVAIADSSVIIRSGLSSVLKRFPDYNFRINEIVTQEALTLFLRLHTPDLLIINPMFTLGQSVANLRKLYPSLKIAALVSSYIDNQLLSDYDLVISLYDDVDAICDKIRETVNDSDDDSSEQESLSSREKEIIGCVVKGLTNKAIADSLSISIYTVITHRRNIARKLQIHSPAGLAIYAIANKLVNIEDIKDDIS